MNEQDIPEPIREMVAGIGQGVKRDHDKARRSIPGLEHAEATRARRDAEWKRKVHAISGGESFGEMIEVGPDDPCDRCGHVSKYHASPERGAHCMVAVGHGPSIYTKHANVTGKVKQCFCDAFWPVPSGVSR